MLSLLAHIQFTFVCTTSFSVCCIGNNGPIYSDPNATWPRRQQSLDTRVRNLQTVSALNTGHFTYYYSPFILFCSLLLLCSTRILFTRLPLYLFLSACSASALSLPSREYLIRRFCSLIFLLISNTRFGRQHK